MRLAGSKVAKSTVLAVAGILLIPLLIGYAMVYSLVTNADVKYAKEVEIKVLATQMSFVVGSIAEMKESIGQLNTTMGVKLESLRQDLYRHSLRSDNNRSEEKKLNGQTGRIN